MEEKLLDILAQISDDDIVKQDLDVELFNSGLLDSLAFTELLVMIEDELGVFIAPSEVERTTIDTPKKLIEFVKSKS